jgi:hypothetical protein
MAVLETGLDVRFILSRGRISIGNRISPDFHDHLCGSRSQCVYQELTVRYRLISLDMAFACLQKTIMVIPNVGSSFARCPYLSIYQYQHTRNGV